jgi:hypothetical protein
MEGRRVVGRPFPKGVSGNPSGLPGRPRTKHITRAAEKLVAQRVPEEIYRRVPELQGKTWAQAIIYAQALQAIKGDTSAAQFVADRSEGKVGSEEPEPLGNKYVIVFEGGLPRTLPENEAPVIETKALPPPPVSAAPAESEQPDGEAAALPDEQPPGRP